MKKLIYLAMVIISVIAVKGVFASPELDQTNSGLDDYQIQSSDENEFSQAEVENLEGVISNRVELSEISFSRVSTRPIISGINDPESLRNESRTCPFCWTFLLIYSLVLIFYGEKLQANPERKDWFAGPVYWGIFIFIVHAWAHDQFASSIFLNYYWMGLYDELLIAYFMYSHFIIRPYQKVALGVSKKRKKK